MIPKIVHYCWFGGNPLPEDARKCVDSWRRFFPDYEIREWNESNYDVRSIPYIAEAYAAGKYAFVSDYARMDILLRYGGVYFDTDVEVIRPFDDILAGGAFMGCEIDGGSADSPIMVNPGLGLGLEAGNPVAARIVEFYRTHNFRTPDGGVNPTAIVKITTEALKQGGLENKPGFQTVEGVTVYPREYFNPFDDLTGKLHTTPRTHSIHWFSKTWMKVSPMRQALSRFVHRMFGADALSKFRKK